MDQPYPSTGSVTGHHYQNLNLSDNVQAHLGDVYNSGSNSHSLSFFRTSSYEQYKDVNPQRADGTCNWCLDHPKYRRWLNNADERLLWVSADPGCGKSVLAKFLVDQELARDQTSTICYFFFKENHIQSDSANTICALLHQIMGIQPTLFSYAQQAIERDGEHLKTDFGLLWQLLFKVVEKADKPVVCVLDALDECEEHGRRQLINSLKSFYSTAQRLSGQVATITHGNVAGASRVPEYQDQATSDRFPNLKILVTSRPYGDIERAFYIKKQSPVLRLNGEDESETIQREINIFIQSQILDLREEIELTDIVATALQKKLTKTGGTTYLWVYVILNIFRNSFEGSKQK